MDYMKHIIIRGIMRGMFSNFKRFWKYCVTLRIGTVLDIVHCPHIQNRYGACYCPLSGQSESVRCWILSIVRTLRIGTALDIVHCPDIQNRYGAGYCPLSGHSESVRCWILSIVRTLRIGTVLDIVHCPDSQNRYGAGYCLL
jgi:hypothetical protein